MGPTTPTYRMEFTETCDIDETGPEPSTERRSNDTTAHQPSDTINGVLKDSKCLGRTARYLARGSGCIEDLVELDHDEVRKKQTMNMKDLQDLRSMFSPEDWPKEEIVLESIPENKKNYFPSRVLLGRYRNEDVWAHLTKNSQGSSRFELWRGQPPELFAGSSDACIPKVKLERWCKLVVDPKHTIGSKKWEEAIKTMVKFVMLDAGHYDGHLAPSRVGDRSRIVSEILHNLESNRSKTSPLAEAPIIRFSKSNTDTSILEPENPTHCDVNDEIDENEFHNSAVDATPEKRRAVAYDYIKHLGEVIPFANWFEVHTCQVHGSSEPDGKVLLGHLNSHPTTCVWASHRGHSMKLSFFDDTGRKYNIKQLASEAISFEPIFQLLCDEKDLYDRAFFARFPVIVKLALIQAGFVGGDKLPKAVFTEPRCRVDALLGLIQRNLKKVVLPIVSSTHNKPPLSPWVSINSTRISLEAQNIEQDRCDQSNYLPSTRRITEPASFISQDQPPAESRETFNSPRLGIDNFVNRNEHGSLRTTRNALSRASTAAAGSGAYVLPQSPKKQKCRRGGGPGLDQPSAGRSESETYLPMPRFASECSGILVLAQPENTNHDTKRQLSALDDQAQESERSQHKRRRVPGPEPPCYLTALEDDEEEGDKEDDDSDTDNDDDDESVFDLQSVQERFENRCAVTIFQKEKKTKELHDEIDMLRKDYDKQIENKSKEITALRKRLFDDEDIVASLKTENAQLKDKCKDLKKQRKALTKMLDQKSIV